MTGEQWDLPNGWAPTNWIAFEGLRNYGLKELADSLTSKWVRKNYNMWRNSGGIMFEKVGIRDSIIFCNHIKLDCDLCCYSLLRTGDNRA